MASMEEERWRAMPLDAFLEERSDIYTTHEEANRHMHDLLGARDRVPGSDDPRMIAAIRNERVTGIRREAYYAVMHERIDTLSFSEQLARLRAAPSRRLEIFYMLLVQDRMRHIFYNEELREHLTHNHTQALLENYNIPEMLSDVREWAAWRALNPMPYLIREPSPLQMEEMQASLLRALEAIREVQRQRRFVVASGLHPRSRSLLRRLDTSLLKEITATAALPTWRYRYDLQK